MRRRTTETFWAFANWLLAILFLTPMVWLKIYIAKTGDFEARWLLIQYQAWFLIITSLFVLAWIGGTVAWFRNRRAAASIWVRLGNQLFPIIVIYFVLENILR